MNRPLMTTAEVAEHLRLSQVSVRNLARAGQIPAVRVGRQLRFDPADFKPRPPRTN